MVLRVDQDHNRFREIVRGRIRKELKKYIAQGDMVGRQGQKLISIPVPSVDLPHFRLGKNQGGVGQGEGNQGDPVGEGEESDVGQAGDQPGRHLLEVELTLDELAAILGEELELPRIEPRGTRSVVSQRDRYRSVRRTGPESLRHFKRTYKKALRRQIASGVYNPDRPVIIPIKEDRVYRSWKDVEEPESSAVIVYMMDVSGSMGDEQKEIVRIEAFWIDTWLQSQYRRLETRYIVHDAAAKVVDRHTFFHLRESGGTKISSAYDLARRVIEDEFSPADWNVYLFHFSDGDNWGGGDTETCLKLLGETLLPAANLFAYGQVESPYGSGQFIKDLEQNLSGAENMVTSRIPSKDAIYGSIKEFLGEGAMNITQLPPLLAKWAQKIEGVAASYGLDFYPVIFEMVDFETMNEVAAYGGFPTRYRHWRWGMEYESLSKGYRYGLSKIYELVINNNPCYAYLLESNAVVDQKLVMAHVYAHCDFFKNNISFSRTNRKMMDETANHAARVDRYINEVGLERVEAFLDACLTIEDLVDPHAQFIQRRRTVRREGEEEPAVVRKLRSKNYMDSYINPPEFLEAQQARIDEEARRMRSFPEEPERDILLFLMEHAPLEKWQRDILSIIREEAYYFAPQGQTKIMNEGWASFWHSRMMTEKLVAVEELVDYADHHSGTVATSPGRLNPYKIGIELFRDIEERWNKGRFGKEYDECDSWDRKRHWDTGLKQGREKVFEVRKIHNDVTFIDTYLTEDFCRQQKLFTFAMNDKSQTYEIQSREFRKVREMLLFHLTNHGRPFIYVKNGNHANRGELLLWHRYEGIELKRDYAEDTLKNLEMIWGRPVHVETVMGDTDTLISCVGGEVTEAELTV